MANVPRVYRIGEVAELTGLTVDALRYYERMGLLPRAPRTDGGFRRYDDRLLHRVRFIKQAQRLGLTLRDIQELVGSSNRSGRTACRRVRDLLSQRIADLDARLAELHSFRRTLTEYLSACERALRQAGEPQCPTLDALDKEAR